MMIIESFGLTKKYGEKTAVNDLSFSVEQGQIYGFLGPNGAGKSTTIKMLTGLVFPTSGSGRVLGKPLGDVNARVKMGYLPELFRYQEWMSGEDLLNFHTSLFRLKKDRARNERILKKVGLLGQEKYKVGSYSKGMQQRLGLACALIPDPELLFLDEPTSALDPLGRKEVRDIIRSLKEDGTTVFLNSHLLSEVEAVSDSITIINKGRVVKSGAMRELLAQKLTLTVRLSEVNAEILNAIKTKYDANPKEQEDQSLVLAVKSEEEIPEIAKLLVSSGARIYELTPRHETLESFFIEAVGSEEAK